jgi:predicted membrane protein
MWKYTDQLTVRWLSFVLAIVLLAGLLWHISDTNPEILTRAGIKAELTKLSVEAEFQPVWVWPAAFFVITLLLLAGVPSLICFAGLLPILGFYLAFIVTFLCQVFVTRISVHRAWKSADSDKYQKSISPGLKSLLWQNQDKFISFAFWARVYFAYPLRTIDYLTPMIQPDELQLRKTLMPAAQAILLRMLVPTLWLNSLLILIKNLTPDPAADVSRFLLWSSALIAYTMIPRIPELFIGPEAIKGILRKIETPLAKQQKAATDAQKNNQEPGKSPASKAAVIKGAKKQTTAEAAQRPATES